MEKSKIFFNFIKFIIYNNGVVTTSDRS